MRFGGELSFEGSCTCAPTATPAAATLCRGCCIRRRSARSVGARDDIGQRDRVRLILTWVRPARLISHCDEQGRDMLAVPADLGKGWARASGRNARWRQVDADVVGLRVGASNLSARARVIETDVLDRLPAYVFFAALCGTRSDEAPESAVAERRDRFREWCCQSRRTLTRAPSGTGLVAA